MSTSIEAIKIHDLRSGEVETNGTTILVDRMWPRGVAKADVDLDDRMPEVAPSPDLRTWFGHDPKRFEEFTSRYREELDERVGEDEEGEQLRELIKLAEQATEKKPLALVYGAKDRQHNHAVVLRDWLRDELKAGE
ncbi:MAG: DUF488 family protein [Flaviflexus sp.]|nr:DUF488 family protein [Flaviflexus sp.]